MESAPNTVERDAARRDRIRMLASAILTATEDVVGGSARRLRVPTGQVMIRGGNAWVSGATSLVRELASMLGDGVLSRRNRPRLARMLGLTVTAVCVWKLPWRVLRAGLTDLVSANDAERVRARLVVHRGDTCVPVVTWAGGRELHCRCQCQPGSVCLGLLAHLRTYAYLRPRNAALLATLRQRAKAWQLRQAVSDYCFSRYAPTTIALAFRLSNAERLAHSSIGRSELEEMMRMTIPEPSFGSAGGFMHNWRKFGLLAALRREAVGVSQPVG